VILPSAGSSESKTAAAMIAGLLQSFRRAVHRQSGQATAWHAAEWWRVRRPLQTEAVNPGSH